MKKNFILFTLMCLLVFVCNNMNVSANTDNIELEAQTYAKSQYKSYCITSNNNSDAQINITNIKLGQGKHIFTINEKQQDASFLFPVIDGRKCVAIFEVEKTSKGWCGTLCMDNIADFERIVQSNDEYVLYQLSQYTYAETATIKCIIHDDQPQYSLSNEEKRFAHMSYNSKKRYLYKLNKTSKYIIQSLCDSFDNHSAMIGYTPKLDVNTGSKVVCSTKGYLSSQGDLPICWAACVASSYNYYFGKKITAKNVCKKMNSDYTAASNAKIIKAFKKCKLNYKLVSVNFPNLSNINACLRDHFLLTAKLVNKSNASQAHVVLITGTDYRNGESRIQIYNPQGNGSSKWIRFVGEGTNFIKLWKWRATFLPADHKPDNY